MAELEANKSELEATIRSAQPDEDEDAQDEEAEETLPEADLKGLKKGLAAVKKALKAKQQGFLEALEDAREELDEDNARDVVVKILRGDQEEILKRYINDHRHGLVAVLDVWWDKYRIPLTCIERQRSETIQQLRNFLWELGYERSVSP